MHYFLTHRPPSSSLISSSVFQWNFVTEYLMTCLDCYSIFGIFLYSLLFNHLSVISVDETKKPMKEEKKRRFLKYRCNVYWVPNGYHSVSQMGIELNRITNTLCNALKMLNQFAHPHKYTKNEVEFTSHTHTYTHT